jgi:excisionase family DNA binding protein
VFRQTGSRIRGNLACMTTSDNLTSQGLTPAQVATFLGMKTSSIYALISRGYLQANRVGSRRLITAMQLDHYLLNRGSHDQIIDYSKPSTLLSGSNTLQASDNLVSHTSSEGW